MSGGDFVLPKIGGAFVRGAFVRGAFVRGAFVRGGFCPGGFCPGGILSWTLLHLLPAEDRIMFKIPFNRTTLKVSVSSTYTRKTRLPVSRWSSQRSAGHSDEQLHR